MRPVVIFLLFFWFSGSVFGQVKDPCYQEAMASYYKVEYEEAYLKIQNCYQADTLNETYIERMAFFSYRLGANNLAKKWYHVLHSLDSTSIEANHYLGIIYEQEEYYPKALKHYSALIQLSPDNPQFWKKTASIYFKVGLQKEGLSYYQRSNELNPADLGVIKVLSDYYIGIDSVVLASQLLESGLKLDSTNIGLIQIAAKLDYKVSDFRSASNRLSSLLRKVDLSPYYNKMLGYSFLQIDSIDQAIFHLEKSLVNNNKPESIHYYLGNAYAKKGDPIYAQYHYKKAIDAGISDNLGIYHKQLAGIQEKEKDYKAAIGNYRKAYDYTSDDEILFFLGLNCDLYYKDKTMAINYFSRYASSDHPNNSYKKYAIERMRYLREIAHFTKDK